MLSPRQPALRGTCRQAAERLAASEDGLTVVRGWYLDAHWGTQEHWWCVRTDGEIVDPTVEQFPTGHLPALRHYVPFEGLYPCVGCGVPVEEDQTIDGFCCGACYGSTVGVGCSGGPCRCGEPDGEQPHADSLAEGSTDGWL